MSALAGGGRGRACGGAAHAAPPTRRFEDEQRVLYTGLPDDDGAKGVFSAKVTGWDEATNQYDILFDEEQNGYRGVMGIGEDLLRLDPDRGGGAHLVGATSRVEPFACEGHVMAGERRTVRQKDLGRARAFEALLARQEAAEERARQATQKAERELEREAQERVAAQAKAEAAAEQAAREKAAAKERARAQEATRKAEAERVAREQAEREAQERAVAQAKAAAEAKRKAAAAAAAAKQPKRAATEPQPQPSMKRKRPEHGAQTAVDKTVSIEGHPRPEYNGLYTHDSTHEGWPVWKNAKGKYCYRHPPNVQTSKDKWLLWEQFTPDDDVCAAAIVARESALPVGSHAWRVYSGSKWVGRTLTIPVQQQATTIDPGVMPVFEMVVKH
eukprot:COSAG04_NODE_15_length_40535_cov_25.319888_14_plen_386_part_00